MAKKTLKVTSKKTPAKVPAAKKPKREAISGEAKAHGANFEAEPSQKALKAYKKFLSLKADIETAKQAAQEACDAIKDAFGRKKGFSFRDEEGNFITVMPKTIGGNVKWFTRGEPTFEGGQHPSRGTGAAKKPKAAKAPKAEKAAKKEKSATKEKPAAKKASKLTVSSKKTKAEKPKKTKKAAPEVADSTEE